MILKVETSESIWAVKLFVILACCSLIYHSSSDCQGSWYKYHVSLGRMPSFFILCIMCFVYNAQPSYVSFADGLLQLPDHYLFSLSYASRVTGQ